MSFDDGKVIESSQIMSSSFINENKSSIFFPDDEHFWNVFGIGNQTNLDIQDRRASYGSLLIQFSQLNSGSGILSNSHFADDKNYISTCLGSCPLNFSFNSFLEPTENDSRLVSQENIYQSSTCLSCSPVYPMFNISLLSKSLSSISYTDLIKNFTPQKSKLFSF